MRVGVENGATRKLGEVFEETPQTDAIVEGFAQGAAGFKKSASARSRGWLGDWKLDAFGSLVVLVGWEKKVWVLFVWGVKAGI